MSRLENTIISLISKANEMWKFWAVDEPLLVAVSGGKDSLALLQLLSKMNIRISAVHVELTHDSDLSFIPFCQDLCETTVIKTNIYEKSHMIDCKKNPCFICSRERRKVILEYANAQNIKTIVFGHHKQDVVVTFLLNMLYSREISTMNPKQELFKGDFHIIRPFYLTDESLIAKYAIYENLPIVKAYCQEDLTSKRSYIKSILLDIKHNSDGIDVYDNIFSSLKHINSDFLPQFPL